MTKAMAVNFLNPVQGVNAARVIRGLVEKDRTIETLRDKPTVRFSKKELQQLTTMKNHAITNGFANGVVQSALSGNAVAVALFRSAQLKTQGLTGTIHGNEPAVIDLKLLGMNYCGPCNPLEAKVIKYRGDCSAKPEDIKTGVGKMPLAFRWGVVRDQSTGDLRVVHGKSQYVPNKAFDKWLIYSPAHFANTTVTTKLEEIEKPVEIDGLVIQGKDGGQKLEIRSASPFSGRKSLTLPFFTKEDEQVQFIDLNIEYKKAG